MTPSEGQRPLRGPGSPGPEEDDPTGIRDLLRTLPDPGPMPEDLVARISARLDAEEATRGRETGAGHPAPVADLAARRGRRRPGRSLAYMGVAAAGLLVATVAVGELAGDGFLGGTAGLDSAAQVSTHSRGAADAGSEEDVTAAESEQGLAAEGEAGAAADDAGGGAEEAAPDAGDSEAAGDGAQRAVVELLPPLGEISAGAVREDVLAALQRDGDTATTEGSLTSAGAESCWQAGGDGQDWPVRQAAEAVFRGDPVVVLVGRDGDAGAAVLLPASCTGGAAVEPLDALVWGR